MSQGQKAYQKAQEYKAKYIKNRKENKQLFTESYREKTIQYLKEAYHHNHPRAAYELAIFYSQGQNLTKTDFRLEKTYNASYQNVYLSNGAIWGDKDALYYWAMICVLKKTDDALQWALKANANGRPQDYLPLAKYYQSQIHQNNSSKKVRSLKKELYELLDKNKPQLNYTFLTWEFALEYCDGLATFGREDEALELLNLMLDNLSLTNIQDTSAIYRLKAAIYREKEEYTAMIDTLMKMDQVTFSSNGLLQLCEMAEEDEIAREQEELDEGDGIFYEDVLPLLLKTISSIVDVNRNPPQIKEDLFLFAIPDCADIFYQLGCFYMEGKGVDINRATAFFYLNKAYEMGIKKAKLFIYLGDCYHYGYGTQVDYSNALKFYQLDSRASFERQDQVAFDYFRLQNYNEAMKRYNDLFQYKYTTNPPLWLLEGLGYMYFNGKGTNVNYQRATEMFEKGIQFNSAYSYNMLGLCYLQTNRKQECFNLFSKAYALKPEKHVEYNIGRCYEFGLGVDIDLYQAKQWYEKAVSQNYSYAIERLDGVNKKIAQEKIEKPTEINKKKETNTSISYVQHQTNSNNAKQELSSLIGLESVKEEVEELEAQIIDYKRRLQMGLPATTISKHMVFTGNAGTGKTTVARIIASILKENGIVSKGQLVETDRAGLVGQYIGETGQKTKKVVESAIGGVLFIDEAYALVPKDSNKDFGQEAIAVLLKMMEDYKDDLVVIVAGYKKEMKHFIDANPGLKSRFTTYIDFPDYSVNELCQIFEKLASKDQNRLTETSLQKLKDLCKQAKQVENFGNGRAVRNIYEEVIKRRSKRLRHVDFPTSEQMLIIEEDDIPSQFNFR